jgi:hypothetical protein
MMKRMRRAFLCLCSAGFAVTACGRQSGVTAPHAHHDSRSDDAAARALSVAKPVWRYQMHGNLDAAELRCDGEVNVEANGRNAGSGCWAWTLGKVHCEGNRDVDWVHIDESSGEICPADSAWKLARPSLPGRGACHVRNVVTSAAALQRFELHCTWECRDPAYSCAGAAEYSFVKP